MNSSDHKTGETFGSYIKDNRIMQQQDPIPFESEKTENDIYNVSHNNDESYVDEYQKNG